MSLKDRESLVALAEGTSPTGILPTIATPEQRRLVDKLQMFARAFTQSQLPSAAVNLDDALLLPTDTSKLTALRRDLQKLRRALVHYAETLELMRLDTYDR